jgi:hypothetical protein
MKSLDFGRGTSRNQSCFRASLTVILLSGSYVRSLFSKSNPASDRTGAPVNEVAGNFLRNRLYLKVQVSGEKSDITTMKTI